jgi:hypothetical protein
MLLRFTAMRVALAVLVVACVGCKKKSDEGFPAAASWNQGDNAQLGTVEPAEPVGPPNDDVHAGVMRQQQQEDGEMEEEGVNPHEPASHATASDDPAKKIRGVVKVSPKLRDRVKPGAIVFLFVKAVGPDGQPSGPPAAVDRMDWTADGAAFELGSELAGEVFVMARFDQDGDAMKPQAGDITAQKRVKLPAERVELVLDTLVP